jgi:hypothetical protein
MGDVQAVPIVGFIHPLLSGPRKRPCFFARRVDLPSLPLHSGRITQRITESPRGGHGGSLVGALAFANP